VCVCVCVQGIAAYVPATPKYIQQWLTVAKETGNEYERAAQSESDNA